MFAPAYPSGSPTVFLGRAASDSPGEIVIAWDTPDPEPSHCHVSWTPEGGDMVSWREENWPDRGNDYPGGASLSDTLRGLSEGTAYQVHLRARYTPGSTPTPRGAAPGPVER